MEVRRTIINIIARVLLLVLLLSPVGESVGLTTVEIHAQGASKAKNKKRRQSQTSKSSGKSGSKQSQGKKATGQKGTAKGSTKSSAKQGGKSAGKNKKGKGSGRPETSADLKRQQENAQREVARTQEQIRLNESEVKKNLNELGKIDSDISVISKEVSTLQAEVEKLQKSINTLQGQINENNGKLERLRGEYLKAVKKMRGSRKRNSQLAFVFSSSDFSQAERRMRYLKEFSKWREGQTAEIEKTVKALEEENAKLERAKSDHDIMLGRQVAARKKLEVKKGEQTRIVKDLKANGEMLKQHLSKKQAEVNQLRSRVSALIAEEERKAAEERRKREAAEAAAREAERQREADAVSEAVPAEAVGETTKDKKADKKKRVKADKKEEKQTSSKREKKQDKKQEAKSGAKDYASARKRKPRGGTQKPEAKKSGSTSVSGNFASMQGSLPRPVSGSFRITSPFGRHPLPELPDVVYDNPGIDAEVSSGATAQAVYGGKVSGVYMVPGFSTVVIVNHGDYYTVYGNIEAATVKVGDVVKTGQSVGRVAPNPDDPSQGMIHFEVWKNRDKLNPSQWIK